jgi:hypothetical protein
MSTYPVAYEVRSVNTDATLARTDERGDLPALVRLYSRERWDVYTTYVELIPGRGWAAPHDIRNEEQR